MGHKGITLTEEDKLRTATSKTGYMQLGMNSNYQNKFLAVHIDI